MSWYIAARVGYIPGVGSLVNSWGGGVRVAIPGVVGDSGW